MSDPQCPSSKGHEDSGSKPQQPRCAAKCCWAVMCERPRPSTSRVDKDFVAVDPPAPSAHTLSSRTARDAGENVRTLVRSRA